MIGFRENSLLFVYLLVWISFYQAKTQENEDETSVKYEHLKSDKAKKGSEEPIIINEEKVAILNNESSHKRKRAAISDHDRLWEEGVIPYETQPDCSNSLLKTIRSAMDEWEAKTCLKFVEAEPIHPEKLVIRNRGKCGCCTEIGRRYKLRQYLTLDEDQCNYKEAVLHELGHTIGFDHEHKRPDRDKYIRILYENIEKKFLNQFSKLSEDEVNPLGSSYDFDSIMHYSSDVYAISLRNATMEAINSSISLDEFRTTLSPIDIEQTNRLYKCPSCLFNMYDVKGTITTDDVKLVFCQWYIRRNRGEFILLFLNYVDIHESDDCAHSYLEIRDGYWSKSPLIGRFCGNNSLQKYYQTQSPRLLITYKSSNTTNYAGFLMNYTVICTGKIEAQKAVLHSEYLQDSYSVRSQCNWIIVVPPEYRVALHFESFNNGNDQNCSSYYLEVRDGASNESDKLDTFCSHERTKNALSSNNTASITFLTNDWNDTDFTISFLMEIDECELPDKGGCSDICNNTIGSYFCECQAGKVMFPDKKRCEDTLDSCGGTVNASERVVITSPRFPEEYPESVTCLWEIINENVRLTFLYMDVQGSKRECQDEVTISSHNMTDNIMYCGWRTPESLTLTSASDIKIRFNSDKRIKKWKKWIGFAISVEPL